MEAQQEKLFINLLKFAEVVRDELLAKYGSLTDTCDLAATRLVSILAENGLDGIEIWGDYYINGRTEGHIWVQCGEYYVDPSVEQFGENLPMVIEVANSESYLIS